MANIYKDQINQMLTDPSSFSGTPGFKFALDNGLDATARSNSAGRNSGNALAALTKYGTGLATQDYGDQLSRLGTLAGEQDQFNTNTQRNANDLALGQQQNDNTRLRNDQDFGLGTYRAGNDFALGQGQLASTNQNNWWNHDISAGRNAIDASKNYNDWSLNNDRNNIDWFNANTSRGTAGSNAWNSGQNTLLNWARYQKPVYNAGGY